MSKYTLIIDQGGHSTRAIIFNKKGRPIAFASEPIDEPIIHKDGFIEYEPSNIIDATVSLLDRLATQLKTKEINKIHSVGIICQRSSIITCNKTNGQAISAMISWQDTRNSNWIEQQHIDIDNLQNLTGLRFNAHAGASKIRWLLDKDKTVTEYLPKDNVLFVPWGAYFSSQLCQQNPIVTDPILAARTGLVEFGQLEWSPELLTLFNIPLSCLPPIVPSIHHFGSLSFAKRTIPVKLLGGDQNFIPYAYGHQSMDTTAFLNIGTGAFIQARSLMSKPSRLLKTASAISDTSPADIFIEGTINGAASTVDWWQQQLPRPYSFSELEELLNSDSNVPLFINTLGGTGSPYWIPEKTSEFISIKNCDITNESRTIAVLESILFAIGKNFMEIQAQNHTIKDIIISGGLSKIYCLCQKLADLLNVRIIRHQDSEASARGACFFLRGISEYTPANDALTFSPAKQSTLALRNLQDRFKRYCVELEGLSQH